MSQIDDSGENGERDPAECEIVNEAVSICACDAGEIRHAGLWNKSKMMKVIGENQKKQHKSGEEAQPLIRDASAFTRPVEGDAAHEKQRWDHEKRYVICIPGVTADGAVVSYDAVFERSQDKKKKHKKGGSKKMPTAPGGKKALAKGLDPEKNQPSIDQKIKTKIQGSNNWYGTV